MTYPHDYQHDYQRERMIDRQVGEYEAGGMLPFIAILGAIVFGIVIYQAAFGSNTTQTATNMPSTMEKVAPPAPASRSPAETTGSGMR
jgi:hypothetical protein